MSKNFGNVEFEIVDTNDWAENQTPQLSVILVSCTILDRKGGELARLSFLPSPALERDAVSRKLRAVDGKGGEEKNAPALLTEKAQSLFDDYIVGAYYVHAHYSRDAGLVHNSVDKRPLTKSGPDVSRAYAPSCWTQEQAAAIRAYVERNRIEDDSDE